MTERISNDLIPQILANNNRLYQANAPSIPRPHKGLFHFEPAPKKSKGGGRKQRGEQQGEDKGVIISVVSDLQLCRAHASEAGCPGRCPNLHICRFFFLDGSCRFGDACKFGHALQSLHNTVVLHMRLLDRCSLEQIRCLIRSNNIQDTLPPICIFYNKHSGCDNDEDCIALHVCQFFLTDECTFGEGCKRSHNIFDPQPKKLLEKHGIDFTSKRQSILKYVKCGYTKRSAQELQESPTSEERGRVKGARARSMVSEARAGRKVADARARNKSAVKHVARSPDTRSRKDSSRSARIDKTGMHNTYISQILANNNRLYLPSKPSIPRQYQGLVHFQPAPKTGNSKGGTRKGSKNSKWGATRRGEKEGDDAGVIVSMVSDLQLCKAHASEAGCSGGCPNLHICRFFFLDGNCRFGDACKFGHTLESRHNAEVLQDRLLDSCSLEQIRCLIRSNNIQDTLPPICIFYNKHSGCDNDEDCMALHVCQFFLTDECTFGDRCKRSHNIFDRQPQELLEKHGIDFTVKPQNILKYVQYGYTKGSTQESQECSTGEERGRVKGARDKMAEAGARSKSAVKQARSKAAEQQAFTPQDTQSRKDATRTAKIDEICTYNLRGKCNYGDKCMKYHSSVPYLWQYELGQDSEWKNVSEADNHAELEKMFCDPASDSCLVQSAKGTVYKVQFADMTMRKQTGDTPYYPVRRLSTMSTVKAAPSYIFCTQWQWYWQDDAGKFQRYVGLERDLEEGFLDQPDYLVRFSLHPHNYTANIRDMIQQNTLTCKKRQMRRRPKLVTRQDVLTTLSAPPVHRSVSARSAVDVPKSWDSAPFAANKTWRLVTLNPSDAEYADVRARFGQTVLSKIIKIQRIENIELWEDYGRMKTKMERKLASSSGVNEKQLFHGTRQNLINPICQQGFDWRMSGTSTGALYGMGSYFARDAKYSTIYTDCRKMFVVRVLVGEYTRGKPDYRRPPPKPSPTATSSQGPEVQLYDACVDSTADPSIFVVFNAHQAYPEYIIEYM